MRVAGLDLESIEQELHELGYGVCSHHRRKIRCDEQYVVCVDCAQAADITVSLSLLHLVANPAEGQCVVLAATNH
jgi:hypothetical protein